MRNKFDKFKEEEKTTSQPNQTNEKDEKPIKSEKNENKVQKSFSSDKTREGFCTNLMIILGTELKNITDESKCQLKNLVIEIDEGEFNLKIYFRGFFLFFKIY